MRRWLYLALVALTALTTGLEFAHVLEWQPKRTYDGTWYVRLQESLYVWFGSVGAVVYVGAVACTVTLAVSVRRSPGIRRSVAAAAALEALALATFLAIVYPVNLRLPVGEVVEVPADWQLLRLRWETGHAIGFLLFLIALMVLLVPLTQRMDLGGPSRANRP